MTPSGRIDWAVILLARLVATVAAAAIYTIARNLGAEQGFAVVLALAWLSVQRDRMTPSGESVTPSTSDASRLARGCAWCRSGIPETARADARFCSTRCRQASWRFKIGRAELAATDRSMRFAYADPPYPGKALYYPEREEVDHASLLERLTAGYPDGWALSTSSVALAGVLRLCPVDVRVCAWVRAPRRTYSRGPHDAWEALIVAGGRPQRVDVVHDVENVLVYRGRFRAFPGAMVGMKPPQFAEWMFRLLGASRGDRLDDLFPGSGAVAEAWCRYVAPSMSDASPLQERAA